MIFVASAYTNVWNGFSQLLKRKNGYQTNEVEVREQTASTAYSEIANSPIRTPVSAKGGRINGRAKVTRNNKSVPSTPISNTGETHSYI